MSRDKIGLNDCLVLAFSVCQQGYCITKLKVMKVKFWGVRGSLPSSATVAETKDRFVSLLTSFVNSGYKTVSDIEKFVHKLSPIDINGYGVATTCVEVSSDDKRLIIDGGSGIKYLSDEMLKQPNDDNEYHILMTHFHFDHILGLPFFHPHFKAGAKIRYYAVQNECEDVIKSLFNKPVFPVGYDLLKSDIEFITLKPHQKVQINGFDVTPYLLDHPDPCYGFRVEKDGKSYGHAVDTEAVRVTEFALGEDAGLYKNVDLLFIDAQYLEEMMTTKKGWGHGTFQRAFNLSHRLGVKQVFLAHYDPSDSYADIQGYKIKAQEVFERDFKNAKFIWNLAYESQEIEL